MIESVLLKDLKIISDIKGDLLHMMRCDASFFNNFGEVYFSFIIPGHIKGWKKHLKQTQNFSVPIGNIKLVMYDGRQSSSTYDQVQEINIGIDNYRLVQIPPGIWYSFTALGNERAMIANCTDIPHNPDESEKKDIFDKTIPYSWNIEKE